MSSIRLTRFGGLNRSLTDRHIATTQAAVAHNTELRDGSLRPYRTAKTVVAAEDCVDFFELPRIDGCMPEIVCLPYCATATFPQDADCMGLSTVIVWPEDGSTEPYRYLVDTETQEPLLVPAPALATQAVQTAVSPNLQADPNAGPDMRAYTITFVDRFGAESAPAVPSTPARAYDDEVWEVTNASPLPPNAACVRVYRVSAEFGSGSDAPQQDTTSFQLVDEIDVASWTGTYTDSYLLKDLLFGTLSTTYNCPPPAGLCGVMETEAGYHVGFVGQDLWFSERHEPWNWQERFKVTLPFEIVGIAVNNDVVYVGTTGNPFIVRTGPELDDLTQDVILRVTPTPYDQKYPMVGRRNITATAWGAAYVGKEGIIGLQPSLPARNITRQHIDEDLWLQFVPNRVAWLNGRLYCGRWPQGPGMIVDVRGEPEGPKDLGEYVTVDLAPDNLRCTASGRLLFCDETGVYEWDAGGELLDYVWRSKRVLTSGIEGMHAAKVVADYGPPVTFRLFGDGRLVYERTVQHSRPFRVPSRGKHIEWYVELEGSTRVHEVHVSTSMGEMAVQAQQEQV